MHDVVGVIYAYVGMLRSAGPQRWVWEEQAAAAAASFRFKNAARAFETVMVRSELPSGPAPLAACV